MSLTTYELTGAVDANGTPVEGATVSIRLCDQNGRTEDSRGQPITDFFTGTPSGELVSIEKTTTTDADGAWSLSVPSNLDGNQDLRYLVQARHPTTNRLLVHRVVQKGRTSEKLAELVNAIAVTPTPETAASQQRAYAEEWAIGPDPVSTDAGGDGAEKSAKGNAEDAKAYRDTASTHATTASNKADEAGVSETAASTHATTASNKADEAGVEAGFAEEWAVGPDPVSVAAGGDGATTKSARGHALDAKSDRDYVAAQIANVIFVTGEDADSVTLAPGTGFTVNATTSPEGYALLELTI